MPLFSLKGLLSSVVSNKEKVILEDSEIPANLGKRALFTPTQGSLCLATMCQSVGMK